jgi:peroxiredoxin
LFALAVWALRGPTRAESAAAVIADFTLNDMLGKPWSLGSAKDHKAVVILFLGTECPINNAYGPRLVELHERYAAKGVEFVAINSNPQDSAEDVKRHATTHKLPFRVLKDAEQAVLPLFGAERTPEAFLLDPSRTVRYRGRIDDQFGIDFKRPKPTREDLATAIDDLLEGKPISVARTDAPGCLITRKPKASAEATVTYSKHVAPLLQKHCQECHRAGQIGPMALMEYDDVVAWSDMIREVVTKKRMPPWHADPKHGRFDNDRSLPETDRATLLRWIEQGCAKGDAKELPPPVQFAEGWRIGTPDHVVLTPKPYTVPAKAPRWGIPYIYWIVETKFEEDRWVQAVEAKPGNRAVVHHILVYVRGGEQAKRERGDGIGDGLLVAYAPGDLPSVFPPGMAKKIPKGSSIVFQMHYTPNGVEQADQSALGLVFAKEPPRHEMRTRAVAQTRFSIPPGEAAHRVVSSSTFSKDSTLLSLFPHMHLRGKSFEYKLHYPDGKSEVLLSVPKYNFDWQNNYRFARPVELPKGSRLECTAYFDNSTGNPNNPDPAKTVRWGEQTWDEMMIGFVDYYIRGD